MEPSGLTLEDLGWKPFFADQVMPDDEELGLRPVRVMAVHRGMIAIMGSGLDDMVPSTLPDAVESEDRATVGDWLLIDPETLALDRVLDRINLFKRQSPADPRRLQLIAAHVDTVFIVTSCNQDFNIARLERYLVLAGEVGVTPVIVLTKIDLAEDPESYLEAARALQAGLGVEMVDGRDAASVAKLATYCAEGQTVALLGSSGVGKSTMVNTLRGSDEILTQEVREIDGRGRHTTTVRQLHHLDGPVPGGWLVDTPGMREFRLPEAATGIAEVFDDIAALTLECRFSNCTHSDEPGCAIQAALADGVLTEARLERWHKLVTEDSVNTGKQAGRRTNAGTFGKRK